MLDQGEPSRPYMASLEQQRAKLDDVERTPSARLIAEMRQSGETFFELARRMSQVHKDYFLGLYPPNESRLTEFAAAAVESHTAQARIEATDKLDFDSYLADYLKD
jgi:glutamate--cysteine ligase